MFKKNSALLFVAVCSCNFLFAEQTKTSLFTSNDPEQIELDRLQVAKEQLDHLTINAPALTAPTKFVALALIGAVVYGGSVYISTDVKKQKTIADAGLMMFGIGGLGGLMTWGENLNQRKHLQNTLLHKPLQTPKK